jgi:hypothetical protein
MELSLLLAQLVKLSNECHARMKHECLTGLLNAANTVNKSTPLTITEEHRINSFHSDEQIL